jgi:hypothetical protein
VFCVFCFFFGGFSIMAKMNVSKRMFMEVWQRNNGDASAVADELGMKQNSASLRMRQWHEKAARQRKAFWKSEGGPVCDPVSGQRGGKALDFDDLLSLAAEINQEEGAEVESQSV